VVPDARLQKAKIAAFNFHPASPEYPGIGCNNFALYENAREYGVTCHHMTARGDTGAIIAVKRFPVFPTDTVTSILARTYDFQIALFYEMVGSIIAGQPTSPKKWTRKPFSREEFDAFGRITPDMSREEIARRVRAISYGVWQPTVELNGFVLELKSGKE
jgi:methionyl-tRNA formyltransferase